MRCVNCGSFLKSLDGHGAKCPNTFQTRNSEPSNSNQEKFKPRGKIKITECPVCGINSDNRRKLDAHLLKMHSMVMDANNHPSTAITRRRKHKSIRRRDDDRNNGKTHRSGHFQCLSSCCSFCPSSCGQKSIITVNSKTRF